MTNQEANQQHSLAAFLARKAEFDALLAELTQASDDHFGADPEAVLWAETAWLADATVKLKEVADQHFRRGEYAAKRGALYGCLDRVPPGGARAGSTRIIGC